MPSTPSFQPLSSDVAIRKQSDRKEKLEQFNASGGHDPKPSDDVLNVQSYPQATLTDKQRAIVNCDATSLVDSIRKMVYTSTEVLTAFVTVAVRAQDVTNCLTESCLNDAFARAAELDRHLKETGEVVGPLHGLPVSIKDHVKVKGLDTSTWAYNTVADSDALVVSILRAAGAIIYVKTQNPQTLLSLETNNNIFGRTVNPYNLTLTSGGSSGGEAALIACRGSPIGVGTDIGGSIRIPAAHCGLYGLKCSVARMPHSGLIGSHDGMDAIVGCVGPLARSARDLELFCRVTLDAEPWLSEPPLLEMPWKGDVALGQGLPEKLAIAILYDDGVVAPHPPITQALRKYEAALRNAGHEVIVWEPLDHHKGWDLMMGLYFLDGGAEYHEVLRAGGEVPVPQTKWILDQIQNPRPFSVDEIFRLNVERETFRSRALQHWNTTKSSLGHPVDAILCPVAPTLAPPHDTTCWWGYTSHWNLLDLPAVVFPAGQYSATEPRPPVIPSYSPRNRVEENIAQQWDPVTYDNAPIGLQLVGRRHNEERLLAILKIIERIVPSEVPGLANEGAVSGVNGYH
ncbi:amidase signature domain-containing protein [Melanogaster broomeanus]|nr:amidase signature domain-containing protein [Melanogaster broomeanus]